ncbi:MAG: hypothetical protein GXO84_07390, partial [Chlorobi bacterium]|nr:hypothetical protein [Chlorobiota bacterium]
MKTKITLLIAILFLSFNVVSAQGNEEDMNSLSIFVEYAKAKNYDAAYGPWMELRKRNPKFNNAINIYGERILKDKIKKSTGAEKVAFINDLIKLYSERLTNFASKTKKGEFMAKTCQLKYDNKKLLNIGKEELYNCFDDALYSAARLLEILANDARSSSEVFAELPDSVNTPELNVPMAEGEPPVFMEKLLTSAHFEDARIATIDGMRVEFERGW